MSLFNSIEISQYMQNKTAQLPIIHLYDEVSKTSIKITCGMDKVFSIENFSIPLWAVKRLCMGSLVALAFIEAIMNDQITITRKNTNVWGSFA